MLNVDQLKHEIYMSAKQQEFQLIQYSRESRRSVVPFIVKSINEVAYVQVFRGRLVQAVLTYPIFEGGKSERIEVNLSEKVFHASFQAPASRRKSHVMGISYRQDEYYFYPVGSNAVSFDIVLN